jgi:hypothetical protein
VKLLVIKEKIFTLRKLPKPSVRKKQKLSENWELRVHMRAMVRCFGEGKNPAKKRHALRGTRFR